MSRTFSWREFPPSLVTSFAGHHAFDFGAVLGAVNASALRADRDGESPRLRALTAPALSAALRSYVMAGDLMVEFDAAFVPAYSAGIVGVVLDTTSALPNADRATAAS